MSRRVWIAVDTIGYPQGGGHLWAYLNWALGLRQVGCQVVWLETVNAHRPLTELTEMVSGLQSRLEPYGLAQQIALCSTSTESLPEPLAKATIDLDTSSDADLLLSLRYSTPRQVVRRFRRSALIDIDPGLSQMWIALGQIEVAPYDVYFSIGETVGHPQARFPDVGIEWHYTPPCVALEWWPVVKQAAEGACFTTISHWGGDDWLEEEQGLYNNSKREGFLPFLDLPRRVQVPLELALCLSEEEREERVSLQVRGWQIRDASTVAGTPQAYQRYIGGSLGEWSCAKPSCLRLQNAWVSDRSLCYLASGKPVVVQDTGPSRVLPNGEGMFRFSNLDEAVRSLEAVERDYVRHSQAARQLAEAVFDAKLIVSRLLERALA